MLRSTAVALFLEGLPFLDYLSPIQVSFPPKLFSHSCGYSLVSLRIGRAYKCHFVHPTFYAQTHILPGKGNGNPLQCYCLENPRDGGTWWAPVYRVAQSRTRLKWLSRSSSTFCPVASFQWWSWPFFFFNLILFSPVSIYVFPGGSVVKNLPANAGHVALIPGLGRSPGGENSYLLQYSCLRNIMGRGTWQATVCGAAESWARLRNSAHTHHTLLTVCVYV